jgi:hypothetical protein
MHEKRRVSTAAMMHVVATAAVVLFALFLFTHNEADVDLWGNVGFVRHLPSHSEFHRTNTFSFTEPNHVWVNHEWLAEYILHEAYRRFGNPGLILLKATLGFLLLGALYASMRRTTRSGAIRFLYLALIVSTLGYGFSTRPHLFTYLLLALLLMSLSRPQPSLVLVVAAAPLGCLWANLHGAFFIGLLLLIIATVCAVIRKLAHGERSWCAVRFLALSSAAFFAGTLLTPYGVHLWDFVFQSASILRPVLSEWAPLNPIAQFSIHADFLALACVTLLAILASLPRVSAFRIVVLLLALVAAFLMRRNIPLFAIVAGVVAAQYVDETIGWQIDDLVQQLPKRALVALLAMACIISSVYFVRANRDAPLAIRVPRDQFPIEAVAFLERNRVEANALVFFDWAEYCIWKLYPHCRVFLDGRFRSAYSEQAIETYLDFIYMRKSPTDALTRYPTDLVFVHVDNPCTAMMRKQDGWEVAYEDAMAVIFVKRDAHAELLREVAIGTAYTPESQLNNLFP